ncbi:IS630 family transposase [Alicyclobacillus dauci]|uniref:IS630 family transposase n=1 Tax=Alicyclobacillus dauci TaxID=1475485 RepID=A0ABY6Z5Z9_9BACL|nr:IS630 family transposase [Alicyclobacillus dauci]WAH37037.1 IS630 family transposase [Alicyclobacillus dauci]WAH37445.1 IS630 family transposase [Alicyclobacillus dauci]
MGNRRRKPMLVLSEEERSLLQKVSQSRTEQVRRVERAKILLQLESGASAQAVAKTLDTNAVKVHRCLNKALQFGISTALDDLPRSGRPPEITPEAQAWIISLACQKPKDLGYSYELWTIRLLAKHIQEHAVSAGHECASRISAGTISKMLSANDIKPHKVRYYLEKRDPDFDEKMAQVLCVYQQVQFMLDEEENAFYTTTTVSYDEKPGIQAIGNTAPDLPPQPGQHSSVGRDHEYVRYGTLSLLAGIDLITGEVIGSLEDRHRSREFVAFLKKLDAHYPLEWKIQMILDNHSAHTSKETQAYLETVPNRFVFVFTPKHASWLNIIESFFAKMTKSMLRHIRVSSKEELRQRIEMYLHEVNQSPVQFHWRYGLESKTQQPG